MSEHLAKRVAGFGTSVFTEMSRLAVQHGAVNLGQGFPNFAGPDFLKEAAIRASSPTRVPPEPRDCTLQKSK